MDEAAKITETAEAAYQGPYIATDGYWKGHLIVDGRVVPHIKGGIDQEHGVTHLWLDNRFGITIATDGKGFDQWTWLLANAMAVAAGWSSFGGPEVSVRINPYGQHAPVVAEYEGITRPESASAE